jgi:hypothetical protein
MKGKKMLDDLVVKKEDFEWLTPQVKQAIESSYRRGYFHGASNCFQNTRIFSREKVSDWIDEKIQSWYFGDKTKKEFPPDL